MTKLLTVKEAADFMQVEMRLLYRQIKTGKIPFYKIGRAIRLDIADLETLKTGGKDGSRED
jgi:excisionase family DNA binding protein